MPRKKGKKGYDLEDVDGALSLIMRQVPVFYVPARELFSSNTQLAPGKTKTGRPYLYLSEDAKRYKKWIHQVLDEKYGHRRDEVKEAVRGGVEELVLVFLVNGDKDTTNMVKTVEDAFAEWLGVDDSLWGRVSLIRVPSSYEYEGVVLMLVARGHDGL